MGNNLFAPVKSKYIHNTNNLNKLESQLLTYSGLPRKWFRKEDVPSGKYQGQIIYQRTILVAECYFDSSKQFGQKEILVLLHGYGGSGALFFPIIKALSEKFDLVLLDIIGMGGSSRPNDFNQENMSPQSSINYFV